MSIELSDERREDLTLAVSMLQQEVRKCKLEHENVHRDAAGNALPIIPDLGPFLDECEKQHGGCPHLIENAFRFVQNALKGIELPQYFIEGHKAARESLRKLVNIDDNIRLARTGHLEIGKEYTMPVPNRQEAEKRTAPLLDEYAEALQKFEPHRQWMITELTALLQKDRVSSAYETISLAS